MQAHTFENLGGKDKKVDGNDIVLGTLGESAYIHPKELKNNDAWRAVVEYQGTQPACGAHAGSKLKGFVKSKRFSPRAQWADLKSFDGWKIDDGTDIRSIFKSITKNLGAVDYSLYGNDVELSKEEYAKSLTKELRQSGVKYTGDGYGFAGTDKSFDALKDFITLHGPTVILMRVTERFWKASNGKVSWDEKDILPLVPSSAQFPVVSGHFVVAHSFDEKYIYFINSFGNTWGRAGHGYFGSDYMSLVSDWGALFTLQFKKDLSIGVSDPDVVRLQKFLNEHGSPVAIAGPGSSGKETDYFGQLTKNAVVKYQAKNGIIPASGYFGPLTRAYIETHE